MNGFGAPFVCVFGDPVSWSLSTHSFFQAIPLAFAIAALALPMMITRGEAQAAMRQLERLLAKEPPMLERRPRIGAVIASLGALLLSGFSLYLVSAHLWLSWGALTSHSFVAPGKAVMGAVLIGAVALAGVVKGSEVIARGVQWR